VKPRARAAVGLRARARRARGGAQRRAQDGRLRDQLRRALRRPGRRRPLRGRAGGAGARRACAPGERGGLMAPRQRLLNLVRRGASLCCSPGHRKACCVAGLCALPPTHVRGGWVAHVRGYWLAASPACENAEWRALCYEACTAAGGLRASPGVRAGSWPSGWRRRARAGARSRSSSSAARRARRSRASSWVRARRPQRARAPRLTARHVETRVGSACTEANCLREHVLGGFASLIATACTLCIGCTLCVEVCIWKLQPVQQAHCTYKRESPGTSNSCSCRMSGVEMFCCWRI